MERILESIRIAKARGATMRVGPELEITLGDSPLYQKKLLTFLIGDTDASIISLKVTRDYGSILCTAKSWSSCRRYLFTLLGSSS